MVGLHYNTDSTFFFCAVLFEPFQLESPDIGSSMFLLAADA